MQVILGKTFTDIKKYNYITKIVTGNRFTSSTGTKKPSERHKKNNKTLTH